MRIHADPCGSGSGSTALPGVQVFSFSSKPEPDLFKLAPCSGSGQNVPALVDSAKLDNLMIWAELGWEGVGGSCSAGWEGVGGSCSFSWPTTLLLLPLPPARQQEVQHQATSQVGSKRERDIGKTFGRIYLCRVADPCHVIWIQF